MTLGTVRPVLALLCLAALAACSDGGGGGTTPPTGGTPPVAGPQLPGFNDQLRESFDLSVASQSLDYTDPAALPSGSANYAGVMILDDGTKGIAGDLAMEARFGDGTVGGSVTNLVDSNGVRYQGPLTMSNVLIDTAADLSLGNFTYAGDLGGTVTGGGQTYTATGGLEGDFLGTNAAYTEGFAGAEFCPTTGACLDMNGGFIAQRQP